MNFLCIESLLQAEHSNDPDAIFDYARDLLRDSSDPSVHEVAKECLNMAARMGHEESQLYLCNQAGIDHYEVAANTPPTQVKNELDPFSIGDDAPWREYQRVYLDTADDYSQAEELANSPENLNRIYNFGHACLDGTVVPENEDEAFRWFSLAANKGHELSQVQVALCYLEGTGVERNSVIAKTILEKLATEGDLEAKVVLFDEFGIEVP